MAEDKKGFVLYADLIHTVNKMPNDKAGELLKHILSYVNDENPTTEDLIIQLTFEPIKQQLKRDLKKYESKKKQWSDAGKASAESRALKKKQQNQRTLADVESRSTDSTVTVKDTVSVKDKVIVKVNDINKRKSDFKKSLIPFKDFGTETLTEFFEYWSEHGERDRKMRFEKEKSFGINRRLATWLKNKKRFEKEKSSAKKEKPKMLTEQLKQDYGIE